MSMLFLRSELLSSKLNDNRYISRDSHVEKRLLFPETPHKHHKLIYKMLLTSSVLEQIICTKRTSKLVDRRQHEGYSKDGLDSHLAPKEAGLK